MIIIPAVDIKQGQCVRLREGKAEAVTVFSDDPAQMARQWVAQGAERLHVVDLDGAFEKGPRNLALIEKMVRSVSIPVQLGGGLRDLKTMERYLAAGVSQVILGTIAQKQPALAQKACRLFPGRIIIGIDARDNRVAVEGWTEVTARDPLDLGREIRRLGGAGHHLYRYPPGWNPERPGPTFYAALAKGLQVPVIAAGGIATLEDVQKMARLEKHGVVGLITGRAIYSGSLGLPEAIRWLRNNTKADRLFE